jgi:hypothetical protein
VSWLAAYSLITLSAFDRAREDALHSGSLVLILGLAVIIALGITAAITYLTKTKSENTADIHKNVQVFSFNLVLLPSTALVSYNIITNFKSSTLDSAAAVSLAGLIHHLFFDLAVCIAAVTGYFVYRSYTKNSRYAAVQKMRLYAWRPLNLALFAWWLVGQVIGV